MRGGMSLHLDGFELPRVSFPAWVIRGKGLTVGGRFIWIMRDAARIQPADIDTMVCQTNKLSAKERDELEELYAAFQRRRQKDKGEWQDDPSSGR